MITAFWSPTSGQSGTTSNMLAIAIMSSVLLQKRILIMHNHYSDYSLEKALIGKNTSQSLFEGIGIDSMLRNSKIPDLSESTIVNSVISLFNDRIHVLPGTTKEYKEQFEAEMKRSAPAILDSVNHCYDLVFVDLTSGYGVLSETFLKMADFIVVNLSQNLNSIDYYFSKYHFPQEKTIYLFGKYEKSSRYNLKNLERTYRCIRKKSAVIPYNVQFMDYVQDGKLIQFVLKNLAGSKNEENQYFIKKLGEAAELLTGFLMKAGDIS
ncbi:MAG: hypothetical protein ACFWTJ_08130 [Lachnoclostridium sp.]|mgnify:CR=1 FL=1